MKRRFAFVLMVVMLFGACMPRAFAAEERQWQGISVPGGVKQGVRLVGVGDKLYALGGYESFANWIYNSSTNKWSECALMPIRGTVDACAVDEKIYVFQRNKSYIYDTETDQWVDGVPLPQNLNVSYVSTAHNQIFVADSVGNYSLLNLESEMWSEVKKIPNVSGAMSICSDLENIFVVGRRTISAYNIETGTFKEITSMFNTKSSSSVILHNGNIYIAAGYNAYDQSSIQVATRNVEIFNIKNGTWTLAPDVSGLADYWSIYGTQDKIYATGSSGNNGPNIIQYLDVDRAPSSPSKLSVLLNVGEATQLSVSQNLADNAALTWSTTNEAVAAVDASGKVTATGEGTADIFAANEDGTFRESIPVRVFPGTADEYRLALHLNQGATSRLYLTDDPAAATWSSADSTVATVSQGGTVTANSRGLAIITATLDSKPYQIYVRVGG